VCLNHDERCNVETLNEHRVEAEQIPYLVVTVHGRSDYGSRELEDDYLTESGPFRIAPSELPRPERPLGKKLFLDQGTRGLKNH
jgi:hypothetical protein